MRFIKLIFIVYTYIIWICHWNIFFLQSKMLFLPSWPPCSAPRSTPPELPAAPDASGLVGCCSLKGNSMTRADPGLFISFQITGFCWIWLGCFCLTKISKMKNQWFDSTISAGGFFLTGLVPGIPRGWENEPPSQTSLSCWSFKHLTVRKKIRRWNSILLKRCWSFYIMYIHIYIYLESLQEILSLARCL